MASQIYNSIDALIKGLGSIINDPSVDNRSKSEAVKILNNLQGNGELLRTVTNQYAGDATNQQIAQKAVRNTPALEKMLRDLDGALRDFKFASRKYSVDLKTGTLTLETSQTDGLNGSKIKIPVGSRTHIKEYNNMLATSVISPMTSKNGLMFFDAAHTLINNLTENIKEATKDYSRIGKKSSLDGIFKDATKTLQKAIINTESHSVRDNSFDKHIGNSQSRDSTARSMLALNGIINQIIKRDKLVSKQRNYLERDGGEGAGARTMSVDYIVDQLADAAMEYVAVSQLRGQDFADRYSDSLNISKEVLNSFKKGFGDLLKMHNTIGFGSDETLRRRTISTAGNRQLPFGAAFDSSRHKQQAQNSLRRSSRRNDVAKQRSAERQFMNLLTSTGIADQYDYSDEADKLYNVAYVTPDKMAAAWEATKKQLIQKEFERILAVREKKQGVQNLDFDAYKQWVALERKDVLAQATANINKLAPSLYDDMSVISESAAEELMSERDRSLGKLSGAEYDAIVAKAKDDFAKMSARLKTRRGYSDDDNGLKKFTENAIVKYLVKGAIDQYRDIQILENAVLNDVGGTDRMYDVTAIEDINAVGSNKTMGRISGYRSVSRSYKDDIMKILSQNLGISGNVDQIRSLKSFKTSDISGIISGMLSRFITQKGVSNAFDLLQTDEVLKPLFSLQQNDVTEKQMQDAFANGGGYSDQLKKFINQKSIVFNDKLFNELIENNSNGSSIGILDHLMSFLAKNSGADIPLTKNANGDWVMDPNGVLMIQDALSLPDIYDWTKDVKISQREASALQRTVNMAGKNSGNQLGVLQEYLFGANGLYSLNSQENKNARKSIDQINRAIENTGRTRESDVDKILSDANTISIGYGKRYTINLEDVFNEIATSNKSRKYDPQNHGHLTKEIWEKTLMGRIAGEYQKRGANSNIRTVIDPGLTFDMSDQYGQTFSGRLIDIPNLEPDFFVNSVTGETLYNESPIASDLLTMASRIYKRGSDNKHRGARGVKSSISDFLMAMYGHANTKDGKYYEEANTQRIAGSFSPHAEGISPLGITSDRDIDSAYTSYSVVGKMLNQARGRFKSDDDYFEALKNLYSHQYGNDWVSKTDDLSENLKRIKKRILAGAANGKAITGFFNRYPSIEGRDVKSARLFIDPTMNRASSTVRFGVGLAKSMNADFDGDTLNFIMALSKDPKMLGELDTLIDYDARISKRVFDYYKKSGEFNAELDENGSSPVFKRKNMESADNVLKHQITATASKINKKYVGQFSEMSTGVRNALSKMGLDEAGSTSALTGGDFLTSVLTKSVFQGIEQDAISAKKVEDRLGQLLSEETLSKMSGPEREQYIDNQIMDVLTQYKTLSQKLLGKRTLVDPTKRGANGKPETVIQAFLRELNDIGIFKNGQFSSLAARTASATIAEAYHSGSVTDKDLASLGITSQMLESGNIPIEVLEQALTYSDNKLRGYYGGGLFPSQTGSGKGVTKVGAINSADFRADKYSIYGFNRRILKEGIDGIIQKYQPGDIKPGEEAEIDALERLGGVYDDNAEARKNAEKAGRAEIAMEKEKIGIATKEAKAIEKGTEAFEDRKDVLEDMRKLSTSAYLTETRGVDPKFGERDNRAFNLWNKYKGLSDIDKSKLHNLSIDSKAKLFGVTTEEFKQFGDTLYSSAFGTLQHGLSESMHHLGDQAEKDQIAKDAVSSFTEQMHLFGKSSEEISADVEKAAAVASNLSRMAFHDGRKVVGNEVYLRPTAGSVVSGIDLHGIADLITETDDSYIIGDWKNYKSGKISDKAIEQNLIYQKMIYELRKQAQAKVDAWRSSGISGDELIAKLASDEGFGYGQYVDEQGNTHISTAEQNKRVFDMLTSTKALKGEIYISNGKGQFSTYGVNNVNSIAPALQSAVFGGGIKTQEQLNALHNAATLEATATDEEFAQKYSQIDLETEAVDRLIKNLLQLKDLYKEIGQLRRANLDSSLQEQEAEALSKNIEALKGALPEDLSDDNKERLRKAETVANIAGARNDLAMQKGIQGVQHDYERAQNDLLRSELAIADAKRKQSLTGNSIEIQSLETIIKYESQRRDYIAEQVELKGKQLKALDKEAKAQSDAKFSLNYNAAMAQNQAKDHGATNIWDKISQGMHSQISRYFDFTFVYGSLRKMTAKMKEVIQTAIQLNQVATDIRIVTGENKNRVDELMLSYSDLAKELGSTTSAVAQSANTWLRQGYSISEANELIKTSTYLSKLGMIDMSTATKVLTSTLKGFKMEATESLSIVDKLTELDKNYAASAGEIGEALSRVASVAQSVNLDLDKTASMIAVIMDVTQQEAGAVGTSVRSILSRYSNVKAGKFSTLAEDADEDVDSLNDVERVLRSVGIQVRSSRMEMRSFDEVLGELSDKWGQLSNVEQNAISTAMAGTRQRNAFQALMDNYNRYQEAVKTSQNSEGTAMTKWQAQQESVAFSLAQLKTAWEELSQKIMNSDAIKWLYDKTKGLVEMLPFILTNVVSLISALNAFKLPTLLSNLGQRFSLTGSRLFGSTVAGVDQNGQPRTGILGRANGSNAVVSSVDRVHQDLTSIDQKVSMIASAETSKKINDSKLHGAVNPEAIGGFALSRHKGPINARLKQWLENRRALKAERDEHFIGALGTIRKYDTLRGQGYMSRMSALNDELGTKAALTMTKLGIDVRTPEGRKQYDQLVHNIKTGENTKIGNRTIHAGWFKHNGQPYTNLYGEIEQADLRHKAQVKQSLWNGAAAGLGAGITGALTSDSNKWGGFINKIAPDSGLGQINNVKSNWDDMLVNGIANGVVTGALSAIPGIGPLLGPILGPIIGDGIGGLFKYMRHRDEIDRKQRVEEAKKQLEALNKYSTTIDNAVSALIVKEQKDLTSEDYATLGDARDAAEALFADVDIGGKIKDKFEETLERLGVSATNAYNALDNLASGIDTSKILAAIKGAEARTQAELDYAAAEEERYDIEEKRREAEDNLRKAEASRNYADIQKYTKQRDSYTRQLQAFETKRERTYLEAIFHETGISSMPTDARNVASLDRLIYRMAEAMTNDPDLNYNAFLANGQISSKARNEIYQKIKSSAGFEGVDNGNNAKTISQMISGMQKLIAASAEVFGSALSTEELLDIASNNQKIGDLKAIAKQLGYMNVDSLSEDSKELEIILDNVRDMINSMNATTVSDYASQLGLTVERLTELDDKLGWLTGEDIQKGIEGLKETFSGWNSVLSDLTDNLTLTSNTLNEIAKKYPYLLLDENGHINQGSVAKNLVGMLMGTNSPASVAARQMISTELTKSADKWDLFKQTATYQEFLDTIQARKGENVETPILIKKQLQDSTITTFDQAIDYLFQNSGDRIYNDAYQGLIEAFSKEAPNTVGDLELSKEIQKQMNELFLHTFDLQIKNLESIRDAYSKINDETNKQLELAKAREKLENAQNERRRVYRAGIGFTYEADQQAIDEAQKELERLETEKDKENVQYQIDLLQQQRDALSNIEENEKWEAVLDIYNELQAQKDGIDTGFTNIYGLMGNITNESQGMNTWLQDMHSYFTTGFTQDIGQAIRDYDEFLQQQKANKIQDAFTAMRQYQFAKYNQSQAEQAGDLLNLMSYDQSVADSGNKLATALNSLNGFSDEDIKTIGGQELFDLYKNGPTRKELSELNVNSILHNGRTSADWYNSQVGDATGKFSGQRDVYDGNRIKGFGDADRAKDTHGNMRKITDDYIDDYPLQIYKIPSNLSDRANIDKYERVATPATSMDGITITRTSGGGRYISKITRDSKYATSDYLIWAPSFSRWYRNLNGGWSGIFLPGPSNNNISQELANYMAGVSGYANILGGSGAAANYASNFTEWNMAHNAGDYRQGGALYDPSKQSQQTGQTDELLGDRVVGGGKRSALAKDLLFDYSLSRASGDYNTSNGKYLINELGTEGIITPQGTLTALPSHSGIVPADLTRNLYTLGEVAPTLIKRWADPNNVKVNKQNSVEDNSMNVQNLYATFETDEGFDFEQLLIQARQYVNNTKRSRT